MILLQRAFALVIAGAMVFAFLVPLAMQRKDARLALLVVAAFVVYLAVNAWIFVRMRKGSEQ